MNKNEEIAVSIIIPTYNRKEDVSKCINSILKSDFNSYEIIVVDNGSTDNTYECLVSLYSNKNIIKIISSEKNLGAGGGRNLGAKNSLGKYLLFIDSDNVVDRNMLGELYKESITANHLMVGPLMLYLERPKKIWTYFADINFYTSKAFYKGNKEEYDLGTIKRIETGHIPNCFMVKKSDFESINGFDEFFIVMYEEADFAERLKKQSDKKVIILSSAITYHNVPYSNEVHVLGIQSSYRSFLLARNRIYFMKKNARLFQFIIFIIFFMPLITTYYLIILIKNKKIKLAFNYFYGTIIGILS